MWVFHETCFSVWKIIRFSGLQSPHNFRTVIYLFLTLFSHAISVSCHTHKFYLIMLFGEKKTRLITIYKYQKAKNTQIYFTNLHLQLTTFRKYFRTNAKSVCTTNHFKKALRAVFFCQWQSFLGHCKKNLDFFVRFTRYKYIPYRKKWACTKIFDFFRTKKHWLREWLNQIFEKRICMRFQWIDKVLNKIEKTTDCNIPTLDQFLHMVFSYSIFYYTV